MRIGIPKESLKGETRVAATPKSVQKLLKLGFDVCIEKNAGIAAGYPDTAFQDAGAEVATAKTVWQADLILKVNALATKEVSKPREGATVVSFLAPAQQEDLVAQMAERKLTILSMDMVPRISRAQSLDALSSMANIAGYRAVVEASHAFGRFFMGQITAAGKVPPAKVMIIGAGVAGLAAIGAACSLGAIVRAFDTRPEVKEQVESMGAEFLELDFEEESGPSSDGYAKEMSAAFIEAEMALFLAQAREVDVIITTALIPGKPAPRLITKEMVAVMRPGSVVVDLAAATGGNCELTQPGKAIVTDNGVNVLGFTDLPGRLPGQSSELYANNLANLMALLTPEKQGEVVLNQEDTVIRNMTVVNGGEITFPPPPISVSAAPKAAPAKAPAQAAPAPATPSRWRYAALGVGAVLLGWLGQVAPPAFLVNLTVFVLACIVGYYVIWNVTHSLHTPLLSVTNAISSIIIVGALLQIGQGGMITALAFLAVLLAFVNIFGGFAVTHRILQMFRKE